VADKFQILSLSGGGIRGLFSAEVLSRLEELEGVSITDHFDMICGTSIGGIIALALASGEKPEKIAELLRIHGEDIFPSQYLTKYALINLTVLLPISAWYLFKNTYKSAYNPSPLKKLLVEIFKDKTIKDLKTRVLIPVVNYSTGKAKVIKTPHKPDYKNDLNLKLVDVALATSAAPTFFPIHVLDGAQCVDGGLVANSPAYMGIHEALYFLDKNKEDIHLLSIGTMGTDTTANHNNKLDQGFWLWRKAGIELTMSASESLHKIWAKHILGENFLPVDETVTNDQSKYISLDNASPASIDTLIARGRDCAQYLCNDPKFQQFLKHKAPAPEFYVQGKLLIR
jgi:patatin-like phospholipase/acyl hydrolase